MPASPELLFDGPSSADWTVALAHGAGAGMTTPFLNTFAAGLASRGLRVARFEFPYLVESRRTGKKRPPDREAVLRTTWQQVVELLGRERLVIGGKSMGGRMASLIADEAGIAGLVCLGYPFHPVGKPERLRVEHLQTIKTPTLIVQGTRDSFGNREEVRATGCRRLSACIGSRTAITTLARRSIGTDGGAELGRGDRGSYWLRAGTGLDAVRHRALSGERPLPPEEPHHRRRIALARGHALGGDLVDAAQVGRVQRNVHARPGSRRGTCGAWCRGSARCRCPAPAPTPAPAGTACSPSLSPALDPRDQVEVLLEVFALETRRVAAVVVGRRDPRSA